MIYLVCAGGHAKVVIEILELQQTTIWGLIDDYSESPNLLGYEILKEIPPKSAGEELEIIICAGDNASRKKLTERYLERFATAVHPSANISVRSKIGIGSVIMASVSVNSCSVIGEHVILNTNCSVDHDCIIGNFVHLSPNVALAGNVQIGEGSHIGIGASVIQNVKIGNWVVVGAGAVIIKDVPDYAVIVGNPGRIIKNANKPLHGF